MAKGSGSASVSSRIGKLQDRLMYLTRATTVDSFRIPDAQVERYRREARRIWDRLNVLRG